MLKDNFKEVDQKKFDEEMLGVKAEKDAGTEEEITKLAIKSLILPTILALAGKCFMNYVVPLFEGKNAIGMNMLSTVFPITSLALFAKSIVKYKYSKYGKYIQLYSTILSFFNFYYIGFAVAHIIDLAFKI